MPATLASASSTYKTQTYAKTYALQLASSQLATSVETANLPTSQSSGGTDLCPGGGTSCQTLRCVDFVIGRCVRNTQLWES